MSILECIGMAWTIVAVWLIGNLDIRGQWLMLVAQTVWLVFAVLSGHWWLAAQSVVLFGLTVRAIVKWSSV